jgi:hypothetical protein
MNRKDVEKLLGGYATGTLTEEERRALYEAALSDQALFDALAREEALKDVFEDPRSRREIITALSEQPRGAFARFSAWMRQPRVWALAGTLAATVVIAIVVTRTTPPPPQKFELAKQQPVAAPTPVPPAVHAPAPEPELRRAAPRAFTPPPAKLAEEANRIVAPPPPAAIADASRQELPATVAQLPSPPPPRETGAGGGVGSGAAAPPRARFTARNEPPPAADAITVESAASKIEAEANEKLPEQLARLVPLKLDYTILPRGADKGVVTREARAKSAKVEALSVSLVANQAGYIYVFAERHLLFSTQAVAGKRYIVQPRPQDRKLTVILSRSPQNFLPNGPVSLVGGERKEARQDADTDILVIDLGRH